MPNSQTQSGQLQRAGVQTQRLISDKRGHVREGGPGSGPHKAAVASLKKQGFKYIGERREGATDRFKHPKTGSIADVDKTNGKTVFYHQGRTVVDPLPRKKESRRFKASRIRESYHHTFQEKGADEQKDGKKNRVYLVTIIEEGLGNSKDKNFYSKEALQSGVKVFEGAKAYADHPDAITEKTLPERSMKDLVGWYSSCFVDNNPNTGKTRLRGKLHFFPSAKWLTDMIDVILTDPTAKGLFGISINAVGKTRPGNMGGEEVNYVEEFQRVDSADVVTEPAARGKFDKMLESRRSVAGRNSRKVSSGMHHKKQRTRESGAALSPEKVKNVADSLVSAYNSDNPDEMKQAAFDAAKVLYASSSISGKGPGQANEEQYSNINPSPSGGGSDQMKASRKMKASVGGRQSLRKGKRRLQAAAGTGEDNEDTGEPSPEDIESNLEEADVEDEEGRSDMGEQSDFGGGSKYAKVKASNGRRRMSSREALEDEGLEDEGLEGLEDEGMEDEDGMAAGGGNAPGVGSGAMGAPAGGGAPGSSRTVAASTEADDDMDDDDEDDDDEDDMDESDEGFDDRPGVVAEARDPRRMIRRTGREADGGSSQGSTIKKASYAGGLGHSGHTALPKGADPDRGYEDSDEDFGKEDDSTSGVGKSYKIKTSRFARNQQQRRVVKPVVREANRRIEFLSDEVRRLRESNRAKDVKIRRYSGQLRVIESGKTANKLLREAVKKGVLPNEESASLLYSNLLGMDVSQQIREIKKQARFIESAAEGVASRLTESVEGNGARGGFVFRESAGADSDIVSGLAEMGIPMKDDE